jgi:hypothetical protein
MSGDKNWSTNALSLLWMLGSLEFHYLVVYEIGCELLMSGLNAVELDL